MSYSLCFVMPAYKRFGLSEITFEQRRKVCNTLIRQDVHADCVVIADDENLDIARNYGFSTVERDNQFLGRRFNDGHEFAARAGFDFSVPVGSDMFLEPTLFTDLEDEFTINNQYAVMKSDATQLATMYIEWGVLQMIPCNLMAPVGFRPCPEKIVKGCDTLTRDAIKAGNGFDVKITKKMVHNYECMSFQSDLQVTPYGKLIESTQADVAMGDIDHLLQCIRPFYNSGLVDQIADFYKQKGEVLT